MNMQSLQERISGRVDHRGDHAYEQVRRAPGWNERKPERYPDLIVQVASEDDVIEAVNFARARHMKIGIRRGGRNWCAAALQEGGLLLDLSRLNQVEIDPEARVATAGPVITSRYLAKQLGKYGLAFPVAHCPCVPLSDFILSGGLGWNAGEWGISCFSLLSIDVVTADGSLLTASETGNTQLLWAARGAGPGFFGVATKISRSVVSPSEGYHHQRADVSPRETTGGCGVGNQNGEHVAQECGIHAVLKASANRLATFHTWQLSE
jgi:FAD/FMN-containing dehydrogenase